jgi:hypothetical protein
MFLFSFIAPIPTIKNRLCIAIIFDTTKIEVFQTKLFRPH